MKCSDYASVRIWYTKDHRFQIPPFPLVLLGLAFASLPRFQKAANLFCQEEDYITDLSDPVDSWSEKDDPIILECTLG